MARIPAMVTDAFVHQTVQNGLRSNNFSEIPTRVNYVLHVQRLPLIIQNFVDQKQHLLKRSHQKI